MAEQATLPEFGWGRGVDSCFRCPASILAIFARRPQQLCPSVSWPADFDRSAVHFSGRTEVRQQRFEGGDGKPRADFLGTSGLLVMAHSATILGALTLQFAPPQVV